MNLGQVALRTHVLLQAEWPSGKSLRLIRELLPTHVIVRPQGERRVYYLSSWKEAIEYLTSVSDSTSVGEAFDIRQVNPVPVLDRFVSADDAPDRCVICDEARLIGFFDADVLPRLTAKRGLTRFRDVAGSVSSSFVADFPEQVLLGENASIIVFLSADVPTGNSLPLSLTAGEPVDVVVVARRGFVVEGKSEGTFLIADQQQCLPLRFEVRAVDVGLGELRVLAFHKGQSLGILTLSPTVLERPAEQTTPRQNQEQPLAPATVRLPDLSLLILESGGAGEKVFTLRVSASAPDQGLNLTPFGVLRLRSDPWQYFRDFFAEIEQLPMRTETERVAAQCRLAAKGCALFQSLFPPELQTRLWTMRNRIKTLFVQSEEPWIPWELCKLCGTEGDRVIEEDFFCERFAITRWLPGLCPRPQLTLNRLAVVVPTDSRLAYAPEEANFLLALAGDDRKVHRVRANFLEVRRALASGLHDGLHFSGHGAFRAPDPNRSVMLLENDDTLTPEDLSGVVGNLGAARPLVFLNACQIGRSAMSLTDIGGWARQFLHAGAAAFVGAYWSIFDRPACDFARVFYTHLLGGVHIGKAAQEARAAIKTAEDPTWLAYTVFADPWANCSTSGLRPNTASGAQSSSAA